VASIFAKREQNDVPMLVGFNAGEATTPRQPNVTAASYTEQLTREFGADAPTVLKLYPFKSDEESRLKQTELHRDQTFGWPTWAWAKAQATSGKSPVYFYYFDHVSPGPYADAHLASPHGGELAYVFDWVNSKNNTGTDWRPEDRKLAQQISQYWVNFIKTGNPNGKDLPVWPPYRPGTNTVFLIRETGSAQALPYQTQVEFFDQYYARPDITSRR